MYIYHITSCMWWYANIYVVIWSSIYIAIRVYIYIMCVCVFVPGQQVDLFCCFLIKWLRYLRLMFMMSCISSLLGELSQNPYLMTFMSLVFWEITTVFGWYVTQICFLFDDVLPCFTHVLLPKACFTRSGPQASRIKMRTPERRLLVGWAIIPTYPNYERIMNIHIYTWYVYYPTSTIIQL